jgi:hypothetical protein
VYLPFFHMDGEAVFLAEKRSDDLAVDTLFRNACRGLHLRLLVVHLLFVGFAVVD